MSLSYTHNNHKICRKLEICVHIHVHMHTYIGMCKHKYACAYIDIHACHDEATLQSFRTVL